MAVIDGADPNQQVFPNASLRYEIIEINAAEPRTKDDPWKSLATPCPVQTGRPC